MYADLTEEEAVTLATEYVVRGLPLPEKLCSLLPKDVLELLKEAHNDATQPDVLSA